MQEFPLGDAEALWAGVATRVIRAALELEGISYADLADALTKRGVTATERSLISLVSRGTAKLTLLLQILRITNATWPRPWEAAASEQNDWASLSKSVCNAELDRQPWVSSAELAVRIAAVGVSISSEALQAKIASGSIPLSLFLACLTVLGSHSLERYIEYRHLSAAAMRAHLVTHS